MKLWLYLLLLACGLALAPALPATSPAPATGQGGAGQGGVYLLDIKGGIGPATRDYIQRGLKRAAVNHANAVVLRIDTPGGLDMATRDINQAILASEVPVIGWVAPQGARAASAGTYILYACHLAAMAPATSVGAATPVSIGGPGTSPMPGAQPKDEKDEPAKDEPAKKDEPATKKEPAARKPDADKEPPKQKPAARHEGETAMERKAINDSVAYLRSLGELRGRNVEFAEAAVRDAATLTASQALSQHVIEIIAADLPSLLRQANGRAVKLGQRQVKLVLDRAAVTALEPDWRAKLLGVLTEPTVAYLLLLVGLYALVIEAYTPGALFPGVTGAICLLLALYALQVLPVNYAGVALIVLGVGLMAAEFAMPSFGSLGIGGVVALVAGSLILFDTDVPGFGLPGQLIMGIAVASALGFMSLIWLATRSRKRPVVTGVEELVGHIAVATGDFSSRGNGQGGHVQGGHVQGGHVQGGYVQIRGEIWQAVSSSPVHRGQSVRVQAMEGLVLRVVPIEQ